MDREIQMNQIIYNEDAGCLTYKVNDLAEIDKFEVKMLTYNNIIGLLPFKYSQVEADHILTYTLSDLCSLERYLVYANGSQILLRVKEILQLVLRLNDYMLDERSLLCDHSRVFVDSNGKIQMIFLPIRTVDHKELLTLLEEMLTTKQVKMGLKN